MTTPATFITVVTNPHSHTDFASRFGRTLSQGRIDGIYRLPHPESPISPHGTSPYRVLYQLGHPDQLLPSLETLSPSMMRQLSHHVASVRKGGKIHLFGVIDNDSPFGNRRFFEQVVRQIKSSAAPVVLHVGVWQPTPREFYYGYKELQSLCNDRIVIGSLFPVSATHPFAYYSFVQNLTKPVVTNPRGLQFFPVSQPQLFVFEPLLPEDRIILANHSLHGLDELSIGFQEVANMPVYSFEVEETYHPTVINSLDRYKHVVAVSSRSLYTDAYFGSNLQHPYFEAFHVENPNEGLEMLISPHYGYPASPYRTVTLLHEPSTGNFDWLLSSYLRLQRNHPYYCCLVRPQEMDGNIVISNMQFNQSRSLYSQMHAW